MHSPVALPEHARWFQPNLGFGITTDGFASWARRRMSTAAHAAGRLAKRERGSSRRGNTP